MIILKKARFNEQASTSRKQGLRGLLLHLGRRAIAFLNSFLSKMDSDACSRPRTRGLSEGPPVHQICVENTEATHRDPELNRSSPEQSLDLAIQPFSA